MIDETQMKASQSRKAGSRGKLVLDKAIYAQRIGMHDLASRLFKKAVYELQGAQVIERSLADEKRANGLRENGDAA